MSGRDSRLDSATRAALRRLGIKLLRLREARGWTQANTALRCGMKQQEYQRIEAGKVNVTVHTLAKLAACFCTDVADLLVTSS